MLSKALQFEILENLVISESFSVLSFQSEKFIHDGPIHCRLLDLRFGTYKRMTGVNTSVFFFRILFTNQFTLQNSPFSRTWYPDLLIMLLQKVQYTVFVNLYCNK